MHAQTVCTRLFTEKEPGNEATGVVCIHVAAYIVKLSLVLYFPQCIRSGLLEVILSTSFAGSKYYSVASGDVDKR